MPKPAYRNHRGSPYHLDEVAASFHRTGAGAAWRWRTELAVLASLTAETAALAHLTGLFWAGIILTSATAVSLLVPGIRRAIVRRAWCVISRHRLQKAFYETRMHTRSGRLPLVLRIRPTEVGERALIWCRAGICFEDFEAHTGEIASACYAREARVERSRRWAQLVTVQIVRRDSLAARTVIVSGLVAQQQKVRTTTTGTAA